MFIGLNYFLRWAIWLMGILFLKKKFAVYSPNSIITKFGINHAYPMIKTIFKQNNFFCPLKLMLHAST